MIFPFCDESAVDRQAIAAIEIDIKSNVITIFMSKKLRFEVSVLSNVMVDWFRNREVRLHFAHNDRNHTAIYHSNTKYLNELNHLHVHFERPIKLDRYVLRLFITFIREYQNKANLPARRKLQELVFEKQGFFKTALEYLFYGFSKKYIYSTSILIKEKQLTQLEKIIDNDFSSFGKTGLINTYRSSLDKHIVPSGVSQAEKLAFLTIKTCDTVSNDLIAAETAKNHLLNNALIILACPFIVASAFSIFRICKRPKNRVREPLAIAVPPHFNIRVKHSP